jgi:RNA polymerase sigma-70 factor (ECF subfamily)
VSAAAATVTGLETAAESPAPLRPVEPLDAESRRWLDELRRPETARQDAVERLHALLLRAAHFEVARRRPGLPHLRGNELEEIALEAAHDALMSVLRRLDDFRGDSRFTTWAYKFALYEAAVKLRRRAWQGRELPLEPEDWTLFSDTGPTPEREAELRELVGEVKHAMETLTPHQRTVLVAVALDGVPIDVLAERLDTTRGALYKTLHDARTKLRRHLAGRGLAIDPTTEEGT